MRNWRYLVFKTLILILLFGSPVSACPQLDAVEPVNDDLLSIYTEVLKCMSVYESFLCEREEIEGMLFPIHGHSREEAEAYLQNGLTCSLANNMLLNYTRWNEEYDRLQLIPGEGIPILTAADFTDLTFRPLPDGSIIFQRDYQECYRSGDLYHFQVTCRQYDSVWLISSFTLIECSSTIPSCEPAALLPQ